MLKLGSGSTKFLIFAGPYLGYALSGKDKAEAMGQSETATLKIGSADTDDVKAMDFGLNIGVGVNVSNFLVTAQYGLGLSNLSNSSGETVKNKVIGISVGYLFGGK
jgi:hypothetical protein